MMKNIDKHKASDDQAFDLQAIAVEHPYYCSDENYYSREAGKSWETMTEFLNESGYKNADPEIYLVFRWDVKKVDSGCHYHAWVFIMNQRNGRFEPHYIRRIDEAENERFARFLQIQWESIKELWKPFSNRLIGIHT